MQEINNVIKNTQMKQKIYILGLVTAMIVFLGTLFKVNHWAGAGILLITGIFCLVFLFIPLALINNYKAEGNSKNRILYIVTWLTSFVVFTGILFKVQHWPLGGYFMLVSIPFPFLVFLPVYLAVTARKKGHNIYHTVYVLLLLMIISCFTALLALNVSKEKMVESFSILRNYYLSDKALNNFAANQQSPVGQKIDELVGLTEDYRNLYLDGYLGIQPDMWKGDLGVFQDSWLSPKPAGRTDKQTETVHIRLLSGLKDLISILEKTPGCESFAAAAPSIFSLRKTGSGNYNWDSDLILAPIHPWLLVYLYGLETNLKMIKATVTAGI